MGNAFSEDGLRLVSCGMDNFLILWNTVNGEKVFYISNPAVGLWVRTKPHTVACEGSLICRHNLPFQS